MLGKILKFGTLSMIVGGYIYVSQYNKLKLNNPIVKYGLKYLHQQSPQYAIIFFKGLLKLDVLGGDDRFSGYVLEAGFDYDANYLRQLQRIGFKGVQVGPVSLNPSLPEEKYNNLGIINALANICTYRSQKQSNNFQIYLNIAPNQQILKYTPYLLDENIIEAINKYVQVQRSIDAALIERIRVSYHKNGYQFQTLQVQQMKNLMQKVEKLSKESILQLNEAKKLNIKINFKKQAQDNYISWDQLLNKIVSSHYQ